MSPKAKKANPGPKKIFQAGEVILEVRDLVMVFGDRRVLDNISFQVRAGETFVIMGGSGCGKTTLIKSILGMVLPDSGNITMLGSDTRKSPAYRATIGYMPQIGRYPENMNIGQVLAMVRAMRGENEPTDDTLYQRFGLQELLHKRMGTLSGGTRQKVSACLAFRFDPPLLILDEPTAGLDPVSAEILKEEIQRRLGCGKTVLITSHQLSDLDDLVNRIILMQDGRIVFDKSVDELRHETGNERVSKAIAQVLKANFA